MAATLVKLRREFHREICRKLISVRKGSDTLNFADQSSAPSTQFANGVVARMGERIGRAELPPQTLGELFPKLTMTFLKEVFRRLEHLRPGRWDWSVGQASDGIAAYAQYEHLKRLQDIVNTNTELRAALGGDYLIIPDLIVSRRPLSDLEINANEPMVDPAALCATLSPLRERNSPNPRAILHAGVSCKWTMRSDRAQNTRTEALNLIRNRKGPTPHIVVVTMEPLPSRLASIAMGTGDVDCVYHAALHELCESAEASAYDDAKEMLRQLVEGRRLRDISDLPLDLAI